MEDDKMFNEPKVEFVAIDLRSSITTSKSQCAGSETEPGGGVTCSNAHYKTQYGNCGNEGGSAPQNCTIFC